VLLPLRSRHFLQTLVAGLEVLGEVDCFNDLKTQAAQGGLIALEAEIGVKEEPVVEVGPGVFADIGPGLDQIVEDQDASGLKYAKRLSQRRLFFANVVGRGLGAVFYRITG